MIFLENFSGTKSVDIRFTEDKKIFKVRKSRLINMLNVKLEDSGIGTFQAESDAVVLIVNTAEEMSETTSVGILGKDNRPHSPLDG